MSNRHHHSNIHLLTIALLFLAMLFTSCDQKKADAPGRDEVIKKLHKIFPPKKELKKENTLPKKNKTAEDKDVIVESSESRFNFFEWIGMSKVLFFILLAVILIISIYMIYTASGHINYNQVSSVETDTDDTENIDVNDHQAHHSMIERAESFLQSGDIDKAVLIIYRDIIKRMIQMGLFLRRDKLTNNEIKDRITGNDAILHTFSYAALCMEMNVFGHIQITEPVYRKLVNLYIETFPEAKPQ